MPAERGQLTTRDVIVLEEFGTAVQRLVFTGGLKVLASLSPAAYRGKRLSVEEAAEHARRLAYAAIPDSSLDPTNSSEHIVDPEEVFAIIHPEIISD